MCCIADTMYHIYLALSSKIRGAFGTIDFRDDPEVCVKLGQLINIIADRMITHPKLIEDVYQSLPETKLEQISQRGSSIK